MPSQSLGMNSPFFSLYHQHPDITHVKVFGSTIFPYIIPCNQHKLQSKSVLCIFLGYVVGYKGTICYHLSSKRQFLCRYVIHDEASFLAKLTPSTSSIKTGSTYDSTLRSSIVLTLPIPLSSIGSSNLVSSTINSQHELSFFGSHSSSDSVHSSTPTPESATSSSNTHFSLISHDHSTLLPIHNPAQIQVCLPCPRSSTIQTRLQIGVITIKDYSAYIASLP